MNTFGINKVKGEVNSAVMQSNYVGPRRMGPHQEATILSGSLARGNAAGGQLTDWLEADGYQPNTA